MPTPRFEVLSGVINGANLVFTASVPYSAGTTALYLNGQLLNPSGPMPAWVETSPATGAITFDPACHIPRVGDVIQMFFLDAAVDDTIVEEVCSFQATVLDTQSALIGRLFDEEIVAGMVVEDSKDLIGMVLDVSLLGMLADETRLSGHLCEEC